MPQPKKQSRPRLDAVIRHIKAGSYDDDMSQLQGAIADRQRIRQEAVNKLVKEVFGPDFSVAGQPAPNPPRVNPFLKDQQDPELAAAEERARQEEQALRDSLGDGKGEDSPDIESRSPIIGSIPTTPPSEEDTSFESDEEAG